jgi:CRP-like cAMP-binding protein
MSALPPEGDALRALAFFSELTDDDLRRVTRIGRRRAFGTGEPLVERGSDPGGLFVLLSGRVSVDAGGAIQELGPGEFFGEMALLGRKDQVGTGRDFFGEHPALDRARRSANVTAVEPVDALVIETIYFEPFLLENPSVAVAILRGVVGRLRDVQVRLEGGR